MEKIDRFIFRLNLPDDAEFKLISFYEQPGFIKNNDCLILELYHTVRDSSYIDIFEKIKKHGFISGLYGNKGQGVYMANHGRYSYNWGWNDNGIRNVIISDVLYTNKCFRYRSEINSSHFKSEYKITDTKTIYPKYFITYSVSNYNDMQKPYVEYGKFGCTNCDRKQIRCDCLQDSYDEFDLSPISDNKN